MEPFRVAFESEGLFQTAGTVRASYGQIPGSDSGNGERRLGTTASQGRRMVLN